MCDVPWFDVAEEGDNLEHDRGGHVHEINGGSNGITVGAREGNIRKRSVCKWHGTLLLTRGGRPNEGFVLHWPA